MGCPDQLELSVKLIRISKLLIERQGKTGSPENLEQTLAHTESVTRLVSLGHPHKDRRSTVYLHRCRSLNMK